MRIFPVCLALAVVLTVGGAARAARDIIVVTDMSPEGRKLAHPSAQSPAFYLPIMSGYKETGDIDNSQIPPSPHAIAHLVAEQLAKQGYFVASGPNKKPTFIIDIAWGYIDPNVDSANGIAWQQEEMYNLVLGHNITNVIPLESVGRSELLSATKQSRFYIILTAFDFAAYTKEKKHDMLWTAKMSVPSDGLYFNDVMDALVKAGGPSFGVETIGRPHVVPAVPDGQVIIGTPTVKKDSDPSLAPDAK